jgi:hypothetical protein
MRRIQAAIQIRIKHPAKKTLSFQAGNFMLLDVTVEDRMLLSHVVMTGFKSVATEVVLVRRDGNVPVSVKSIGSDGVVKLEQV